MKQYMLVAVLFGAVAVWASDSGTPGWAADTVGGRGGQVIKVTTLAAAGPGSLAEALQAKGPRIVVFEVGGIIDLAGKSLNIIEPFLTIAGQTAPAPGITLIRGQLANKKVHDVIIQHIRIRAGESGHAKKSGYEVHGIDHNGAWNVIIDHCSLCWGTDENLSASGPRFEGKMPDEWRSNTSHRVTFSNCILAEGLSHSTHGKGEHSKGSLIHDNATGILIVGNLYASNRERNPLAKGGVQAVIVNNWIANPGKAAMHYGAVSNEWKPHDFITGRLAVVGNVMEAGPDTAAKLPLFINLRRSPLELFMADNLAFTRDGQPAPLSSGEFTTLAARPFWPAGLTALPAAQVKEHVIKNAGARPWDRDDVDKRIVQAAVERKGRIIDSEQDVGGYPTAMPTKAAFHPTDWNLDTMERKAARP
ncbi:MAG: pectate lyase [Kiritimatiellaeota bacterium]|nr:pectate lyase [Kiritimatiellota bacterium]